jgi:predicted acylesterase/phospholipase RssA
VNLSCRGVVVLAAMLAIAATSCGRGSDASGTPKSGASQLKPFWTDPQRKVCLVLSVGGPSGVAHLGAIEAVKKARGGVDCVVGTSFGAIAGSIYATAPLESAPERFERFIDAYLDQTRKDKEDGAVDGAIVLGALGALTGGVGLLVGLGAGAGLGADNVNDTDRVRFAAVMDRFYGHAALERLPIHFATLYQVQARFGYRMQAASAGNVAQGVSASAANPFLFQDVDVHTAQTIDPGSDRIAAVPVEAACQLYPDAALIVVNVTDQPIFFTGIMPCPVLDVRVPLQQAGVQAMMRGPEFELYVRAGFDAAAQALARNP